VTANPPLSLYIHWPFCAAKCPYCDFNSHVRETRDDEAFGAALLREMETWKQKIGARSLRTLFFGGGTPSLMPPALVGQLIEKACALWAPEPDIEITLEANPTSSEAGKFVALRSAGVNRLSLGVQALNDEALKFLGRKHDVKEALSAVAIAAKTFPRTSFDLIYARKGQTVAQWESELKTALSYANGHLSLYELTLEPGTGFAARAATGEVFQAGLEEQAQMYEATQSIMNAAGLPAYEVSNHAKPGDESRHNIAYWNYDEYLGIGPGAHGRVGVSARDAQLNTRAPEAWLKKVQAEGLGLESLTPLPVRDMQEEMLLMGLRLNRGIDKARWQQRFGSPLDAFVDQGKKRALVSEGLVAETPTHLSASPQGMLKLTGVTEALAT
jgi:oxygen-independent coproporphyrinogen-3 oxidase